MKNNYYNVAIIMWASLLAWALNYGYYPLMLQYMSIEDFWVFGSIMGLLNIIGILSTGIILFLNKEISKNINDTGKIKNIFISSLKILAIAGCIWSLIFALLSPLFAAYFKIENIWYFVLVATTILLSFCSVVILSTLRGLKKFTFLSFSQLLSPILKLIIWVWLVALGYNIYGAIYWVILSWLISLIVSLVFVSRLFQWVEKKGSTKELFSDFVKNKKDLSQYFLISFFFALFMNIDVIFVQNIFDTTNAWIYVGIAVLGKFLIFLLLSIETVYYGQIMEHQRESVPKHLIINPIVIMTLVVIWAVVFNLLFWTFILWVLKPELAEYKNIYILSLIFYGLLAYISFFSKICIWWWKYCANKILTFCFLVLTLGVYSFWTESLEAFVLKFISVWILTTLLLWFLFFKSLSSTK